MNAFENLVSAMTVVRQYAKERHDDNLRQFANAVLCGNDAQASSEFWLQELADIELYYKRNNIPFPIHQAKKRKKQVAICISNPPIRKRRHG